MKRVERLLRFCAGVAIAVAGTGHASADSEVEALAVATEARKQGWGTRDVAWLPAYWPNRG